jgi:hypothetical protein
MDSSVGTVRMAEATAAQPQGGSYTMGEFSKAFDRFVAADPVELLAESTRPLTGRAHGGGKTMDKPTGGRKEAGMSADSLSRILKTSEGSVIAAGNSDVAITRLARALVLDPKDGVRTLRRWGRKARKNPYKAMGALATFGEILKRAVALLRRIPQKFGNIIEAFRAAATEVATAVHATSCSITFDLPRTISLAYSWTTPPSVNGSSS